MADNKPNEDEPILIPAWKMREVFSKPENLRKYNDMVLEDWKKRCEEDAKRMRESDARQE